MAGSLSPTFVPARLVGLAVKLPCVFALDGGWPTSLREPLGASVTLWEATAPVKLPTCHCPRPRSWARVRFPARTGWYFKVDSTRADAPASKSPTYPTQYVPKTNTKLQ